MMATEKFLMFQNRLEKVFRHLRKQAKRLGVNCYRIYDHDLPEFPFCIEIYNEKIYIAEYKRNHSLNEANHEEWLLHSLKVVEQVLSLARENIFLKLRQRKPGKLGQYQKQDVKLQEIIVEENGLKFIVNLSDYLDTGLFLDHRITRQMVKEKSDGKRVLNLFSYTGSFSVYAAAGGATEVITADLSNTYLKWAKRNLELNGFIDEDKYKIVQADVIQYLKTIPKDYFDIIIMDPPTFSNSQRMKGVLDIQRDHSVLINDCLEGLKPGGLLYFSTNNRSFKLEHEKVKSDLVKDITKSTTPFDFEGKLKRWCYLIQK
ncbi:MAG TPA: class I SAM-dependent methyltransferase [Chitinophagaceae bacterium]|nr:class I SAM-dependent methyltransferase [Chitinophagaceae bacterium]